MINPNAELFKWGPIDGRIIYVDYFMQNFAPYVKEFPPGWPDVIFHIKEDRLLFVCDYSKLRTNGEQLFKKYVMNKSELKKQYNHWLDIVEKLKVIIEKINSAHLNNLDKKERSSLYNSFHKTYNEFWFYGFLPELPNWGGEQLLKREILKANKEHFLKIFERLSAPEELSFFQEEEYELLQLKLIGDKRLFEEKLKEHQRKYFWIKNSYEDSHVLDLDFFGSRLKEINKEEAEKRIALIREFPKKVKEEKAQIMKEHSLPTALLTIGKNVSFCIWWQDLRKKYIFMANHCIKLFLQEFSKRFEIPFKELCYYTSHEIITLLQEGKKIDAKKRFEGFAWVYHENDGIEYCIGEKANKLIEPYTIYELKDDRDFIEGLPVSRGKVVGIVKILHSPKELSKMKEGEILVAPMTSPDFIIAMRKAVAIITDEGGITSHAAIVSRELGIPCIVGTSIATKFFKDGDKVEVDADKGVIKKLG